MENFKIKLKNIDTGHKILREHFDFRNERHVYVSILMVILALSINVLVFSIINEAHAFSIRSAFTPANAFTDVGSLVTTILQILISFAGALAMIFIILSGIKLVTASGDPQKIASAKNTLLYAIIGLVVAVLAFAIVQVVSTIFGSSIGTASGGVGGVGGGPPGCTLSVSTIVRGRSLTVSSVNGLNGSIGMVGYYGTPIFSGLGNLPAGGTARITVPLSATGGLYLVRVGGYAVICTPNLSVSDRVTVACSDADFNGDRRVNASDQGLLATAISTGSYNPRYDMNSDGRINSLDQVLVASVFGCTY